MQKTGGPILTICVSYDMFLCKKLPFRGRGDCTCIKIFNGINFYRAMHFSAKRSTGIAVEILSVCLSVCNVYAL